MTALKIEIGLDNASAVEDPYEASNLLGEIAEILAAQGGPLVAERDFRSKIKDGNGNTIGEWWVED